MSHPEPRFKGPTAGVFRFALRHEWAARVMDRFAAWYIPRWQRWRGTDGGCP